MIIKESNGFRSRKIIYAIEMTVEVNADMSDAEIDNYIEDRAEGNDFIWCDADEKLFDF